MTDSPGASMPLGLYLHIPFCAAICNYCNFNRRLLDSSLKTRYVEALLREIHAAADGTAADTVFLGGGTPSLLEPSEVALLLRACRDGFTMPCDAEVTIEVNPETASVERLRGFREAGVNRLSLGAQSFRDDDLRRLSRAHSTERVVQAVTEARMAGFDNRSLDLMMWLPQQTVAQWLESVEAVVALRPEHASMYLLEIYPHAPLRDTMVRSQWSRAADDDAAQMYVSGFERLDRAGYRQYEISNAALPGWQCRHNLKYWNDGEWLGFGCGAHSTRAGVRWKNLPSVEEYIGVAGVPGLSPQVERRTLPRAERFEDAVVTGLRLAEGLDLGGIARRYQLDVWAQFGEVLQPFVDQGLLIYDGQHLRLTRQGMLLAHEVMTVFIGAPVR